MSDQKLLDLVEGNARVINEIYCLVNSMSKGIALVLTILERGGVIPLPDDSDPRPDDSADIEPETTADNQTLSTVEPGEKE
jgi:hypothetical protein